MAPSHTKWLRKRAIPKSRTISNVTSQPVGEHVGEQEGDSSPIQLVERFLDLMSAKDIDGAMELLSQNVEYANVGLPTVRGRERVRRLSQATLGLSGAGFEVYMHAISASGSIRSRRASRGSRARGPTRGSCWTDSR